ncbi:hypothetical protein [Amycolatopsis sp. NPDC004378]
MQLTDCGGVSVRVADQLVDYELDSAEPVVGAGAERQSFGHLRPDLAQIRVTA